jgi:hypothetical protein
MAKKKMRGALPKHAHALNIFFSVALYKHEVLFSVANQKKIEQWLEASVRLYLHDRTAPQRKATMRWLEKNRECIWKNAEALFSFEGIIHETVSDRMKKHERHVTDAWIAFYTDIEAVLAT